MPPEQCEEPSVDEGSIDEAEGQNRERERATRYSVPPGRWLTLAVLMAKGRLRA